MSQPDYEKTPVMMCIECHREYTEKQFDESEEQKAPCGHSWSLVFDIRPDCMTEEEHNLYMVNRLVGAIFGE